ncbi:MAG: sigma-70 family RNA polymerase sigma factor [Clostridiales bacterium]|nr:sigma-70 family RNA polymerase sigma factor [Clostridiales bacterium]
MGNYVFTANIHEEYSELIKRVKSGDESAFSEIYEKSERFVYTTCFEILGNKEDAEDAMQETYMALYKGIEGINEGKAFIDWIHTTAYFKATNIRSRKRPDLAYEDALANEEISEMADDDLESLPESLITDKTNRDIIKKIMHDKLSAVQYDTVLLHYYNEMPVAKIAEIMDCPEGTIKTRLKACRAKLKSGIESYEKLHGGEKLVGAAGVPFLTRFFVECSKELTLPVINMFPAPVTSTGSVSSAAETGAKAGQLAQNGTETAEAASNAAKTGRLGQESAKAGKFAKNSGSTANMGSKGGLFASPLAKIGIAVAAVAVVAVPTVIIVTNMNKDKKDDDKVYEIQYDGLYCNIDKDEGTNDIIRFYPDGDLIYTSYDFDDEDECFPTGSWFNLDSDDDRVENGTYEVDEGKIEITIEHGSKDKTYKGEINKNDIVLGKDDKYKFYEFDDIDGYEPEIGNTTESTAETEPDNSTPDPVVTDYEVYDSVTLGYYGNEPINWEIMKIEEGKALLLCKNAIDGKPYHNENCAITWEECSLRAWLNNDFYEAAFTAEERDAIVRTLVVNKDNPEEIDYGNDTEDYIYIPSISDIQECWPRENATPTAYAESQGARKDYYGTVDYWLRTPGYSYYQGEKVSNFTDVVYCNDSDNLIASSAGRRPDEVLGVRPLMWVDLSKLSGLTERTIPVETTATTESPLESKVKSAYLKVVVKNEYEIKEHENYPQDEIPHQNPIPSINYCDLNRDGISELVLVTYNTSLNRSEIEIYTYDEASDEAKKIGYYEYFTNVGNTDGPDVWNEMVYLDNDHILMLTHCYSGYTSTYYEQMDNFYYVDTSENYDSYWKAEWNGTAFDDVVYWDNNTPDYASRTEGAYYDAINYYTAHVVAPVYPGEARLLSRDFSFDMDSVFGRYGTYKAMDTFSAFDSVYAQGHYYLYDDFVAFLGG